MEKFFHVYYYVYKTLYFISIHDHCLRLSMLNVFLAILEAQIFKNFHGEHARGPHTKLAPSALGIVPPAPRSKTYSAVPGNANSREKLTHFQLKINPRNPNR